MNKEYKDLLSDRDKIMMNYLLLNCVELNKKPLNSKSS